MTSYLEQTCEHLVKESDGAEFTQEGIIAKKLMVPKVGGGSG